MIALAVLVPLFVVVCAVWLWQKAQGRERSASDKKLTDALKNLKSQGEDAARMYRNKDNENGE